MQRTGPIKAIRNDYENGSGIAPEGSSNCNMQKHAQSLNVSKGKDLQNLQNQGQNA